LYLTKNKGYHVSIVRDKMHFHCKGSLLFTATVNQHNIALLDGVTEPTADEFAGLISTCPLDINLWHHRFAHLNLGDVKQKISLCPQCNLTSGLTVKSHASPDPICEPCLA
ncbi:hypothetical protein K439DRAFT_1263562, partial [Ramaria rubella]